MDLAQVMTEDHRRCDALFATIEEALATGSFPATQAAFELFGSAMTRHFRIEEELLFPEFEARVGATGGPSFVMRREHVQFNAAMAALGAAIAAHDADECLGLFDSLLVILQQHNFKEERMLYPMIDRALAADVPRLVAQIEKA